MSATPLQFLCLAPEKRALQDLNTNADLIFADPSFGEAWDVGVANVVAIASPTGTRAFNPQSWSGWSNIQMSLGNGPIPPVAGVWYLLSGIPITSGTVTTSKRFKIVTFVAGDNFSNIGAGSNATGVVFTASGTTPTTWTNGSQLQEITADLQFDAAASDVATALNATAFITAEGGVTVTQDTFYFVLWNNPGDRAQLVGYAGELAPLSIVEVATVDDGSTVTELQIVRVIQNAASFVVLTADSDAAAVTPTTEQVGGAGLNAKYRVILTPLPYDGAFSLIVRGVETAMVAWNAAGSGDQNGNDLQTALENLSLNSGLLIVGAKYKIVTYNAGDDFANVGALSNENDVVFVATGTTPTDWTNLSVLTPVGLGNVTVTKEADGQYFIAFQGDMANTAMGTITGDPSGLLVTPYKLGTINFDTPGCALLLGGAQTVSTFLVITAIPPGDSYPREIFRKQISLNQGINYPGYSVPQPANLYITETIGDGRYARLAAPNAFTGGEQTFSGTNYPDGLLAVSDSSRTASLGDATGDNNQTSVVVDDGAGTVTITAANGVAIFAGNLIAGDAGKTLVITSGANAKAGTFTLVAGVATVANTSVTANSQINCNVKTVIGTRVGNPDIVPTVGVGFVATGAIGDTSVYIFTILEVA